MRLFSPLGDGRPPLQNEDLEGKLRSVYASGETLRPDRTPPYPTITATATTLNTNTLIGSTLLKADGCFDAKDTNETARSLLCTAPPPSNCS